MIYYQSAIFNILMIKKYYIYIDIINIININVHDVKLLCYQSIMQN